MNERAILFFCAIARSSASASPSDFASGKFSCRLRRMSFGTVASMSAPRLSKPTSRNIARTSSSFGPMCLRANESMIENWFAHLHRKRLRSARRASTLERCLRRG